MNSDDHVAVGVDVGGGIKGFHAVALSGGRCVEAYQSNDACKIAAWCGKFPADAIGVDAPCRWSVTGRARAAERALMAKKIWCFSTPTRERAESHPKKYFQWMLAGAELFAQLESTYPLFDGSGPSVGAHMCFESFPHAIACALAGKIVSAKQKRKVRRELLRCAGLDADQFSNIDMIDAALCAVAAQHFILGTIECYGDRPSGVIVVPRISRGFMSDRRDNAFS